MMKLYTKSSPAGEQPKEEIIQYLLNYSKQLSMVKINKMDFIELNLN